jgi:hypothetical protein
LLAATPSVLPLFSVEPLHKELCAFRLRKKVSMVFGGRLRRCTALFQECLFVFERQAHA